MSTATKGNGLGKVKAVGITRGAMGVSGGEQAERTRTLALTKTSWELGVSTTI